MLCIKSSQEKDRVYPLDGFKFSLGSATECDIVIEDGMLNDIHALLWVGKDFITVMTVRDALITVDGELVTDRTTVKIGGKVSFADHEMEVALLASDNPEPAQTPLPDDWMLISRNQEMKGQKIILQGECTVGRAKDNTICIPVISLSRHHAVLKLDENGLQVTDNQSANGTFVNGKQLGSKPYSLNRGDVIAFDELEFLVHGPEQSIFSDQTSVRSIPRPMPPTSNGGPTAIDRQKISISQQKPESFTQRFKAIHNEEDIKFDIKSLFKNKLFWLVLAIILGLSAILFFKLT